MDSISSGDNWININARIYGHIKQLKYICSEMKSDNDVKNEISEIFDFYNKIISRQDIPKTMIPQINEFYNNIIQTVQFLSNCKVLGWIQ